MSRVAHVTSMQDESNIDNLEISLTNESNFWEKKRMISTHRDIDNEVKCKKLPSE